MIRRRHVIYVHGYDPQGSKGYYALFRRHWARFKDVWPVCSELAELVDSADFAHWNITTTAPNWRVETRYEFLRYDDALNANLLRPIPRQVTRAISWMIDDLLTGTTVRMIRACWRFWLHLFIMQSGLLIWIVISVAAGWLAGTAIVSFFSAPAFIAALLGSATAILVFVALRPVAERLLILRINNCWPYLREFGRGEPTCFDRPIEAGAARLVAAAQANAVDEIVLIGHSGGGPFAPAVLSRALALDPDLGRRGPRVVLVTLGSVMPGIALHPKAQRMRDIVRRIAVEPSVQWIDCQSRRYLRGG